MIEFDLSFSNLVLLLFGLLSLRLEEFSNLLGFGLEIDCLPSPVIL